MPMVKIRSTVKPAVMIKAPKYKELCPEQPLKRLQVVFNRKTHIAEVDERVAKYLVDTFAEIEHSAPIVDIAETETKKTWQNMSADERKEYKRLKNDKGRDKDTNNP